MIDFRLKVPFRRQAKIRKKTDTKSLAPINAKTAPVQLPGCVLSFASKTFAESVGRSIDLKVLKRKFDEGTSRRKFRPGPLKT